MEELIGKHVAYDHTYVHTAHICIDTRTYTRIHTHTHVRGMDGSLMIAVSLGFYHPRQQEASISNPTSTHGQVNTPDHNEP